MSYRTDGLPIQSYAQENAEQFKEVVTFVFLTIQQPFKGVPAQCQDVRDNGIESRYLWGWKREGFAYIEAHGAEVWQKCNTLYREQPEGWQVAIMQELVKVPGLGVVKAGFVTQLCWGFGGCFDTHNLRAWGFDTETFKLPKSLKPSTVRQKIAVYLDVVERVGGTERLWDLWCERVASVYPKWYRDAEHVSHLHRVALGL